MTKKNKEKFFIGWKMNTISIRENVLIGANPTSDPNERNMAINRLLYKLFIQFTFHHRYFKKNNTLPKNKTYHFVVWFENLTRLSFFVLADTISCFSEIRGGECRLLWETFNASFSSCIFRRTVYSHGSSFLKNFVLQNLTISPFYRPTRFLTFRSSEEESVDFFKGLLDNFCCEFKIFSRCIWTVYIFNIFVLY